jgi:hypothetical protein
MLGANLVKEYQFVLNEGLLSESEARACMENARRASFLNTAPVPLSVEEQADD